VKSASRSRGGHLVDGESRAGLPPVKVGKVLYSVPWRLLGQRVDVRSTATTVQVLHDQALVKTHVAATRGKRTDHDDLPEVMWNHADHVKPVAVSRSASGPRALRSLADFARGRQ